MYNLNGYDYSLEEVQEAAEAAGMELQEYLLKNGMKVSPDKFLAGGQPNTERPEDRGFFEDLWLATKGGLATGSGVDEAFDVYKYGASISDEDLEDFIEKANLIKDREQTTAEYDFARDQKIAGGGIFGTLKAVAKNPEYAAQFIASSAATMGRSLVDSGEVAGSAAGGAAVGAGATWYTGYGAIAGGGAGFIGGLVGSMEAGLTLTELLTQELGDKDFSKENVRAILEDEEAITRIKNQSVARGIAIGAVEGLTLGLSRGVGGKILSQATKKGAVGAGTKGAITAGKISTATTGIEMAGGFTGEIAGQAAAGQEIDTGMATLEAIGEVRGVVNTADIVGRAFRKPATYKINGENRTKQEILDLLDSDLTATEKSKIKFEVFDDAQFDAVVRDKQKDVRLETVVDAKILDEADRKKMVDLEKQRQQAESDVNKKGISMVPGAKQRLTDINSQMEEIANQYVGVDGRTKDVRANVKAAQETREAVADENFEANMEFAKKHSSLYGLNVVDQLSNQEIIEKYGDQYDGANGFILNDEIVINKEVAKTTGIEGANTANHELLHGIIKASGAKIKQPLINDFLNLIGEDNRAVIQQRIDDNYTADYMKENKDEYFTIFSDAIENGDIKFNETVFTKIKDVVRRLFQDVGLSKVDFNTAEGVYNFVRDYNKSIHKGALSKGIKRDTKGSGVIEEGKTSLSNKVEDRKINTDFKSRLDQFTGPAEQRKYTSDAEFKKSNDFANAALALEEDPAVLKKIEKEFVRYNVTPTAQNITDASRILSDKFMTTFNVEKNSLFGWAMGKTPVLTKSVNTVIKNETQRPDASAASIDQTFGEDQRTFDVADDTDINDVIQNNIDGDKLRPRSKVGQKTMLNGEKLFDDDLVKQIKEKALEVLGKDYDITSDEFIKFVTNEFNKTIRPVLQKKVGREAAFRNFIEENIDTDGNPFQEGNISLADIVQMEKMEDNKVFTEEIKRNLKPKAVDVAVAANKLPKDTNRLSGPTLYKYGKPTTDDIVNFMYSKDIGASTRGTRRDRFYLNLGLRGMFDMLVTQATETNVPQKQIAKLAKKLDVPQDIRFSKSSTYTNVTNKDLIKLFNKKHKGLKYYRVNDEVYDEKTGQTNIEKYANDMADIAIEFENKFGPGFINLSMLSNRQGLGGITSEQRTRIQQIIEEKVPNIKKRSKKDIYSKKKIDVNFLKDNTKSQIKARNEKNMMLHKEFWSTIRDIVSKNPSSLMSVLNMLDISQSEGAHIQRLGAEYVGGHSNVGRIEHLEHALQNANAYRMLLDAAVFQSKKDFDKTYEATVKNYKLIGLTNEQNNLLNSTSFKNKMSLDQSWNVFDSNWFERYFNEVVGAAGGIDPLVLKTLDGKTFTEAYGVDTYGRKTNLNIEKAKSKAKINHPKVLKFSKSRSNNKILNDLNDHDTALRNARDLNAPVKGISVFDFDDTIATSKSQIIVTMPNGKVKKITPAEFAKQHSKLEDIGAKFDFKEFNKVIDGKPALGSKKLQKAINKFGNKDVFVLTARPQASAKAIHAFLKGIGLEIPLANITGLENGTPQAKANWIINKAKDGYNDFYFTDDVYKNVKAVQDALEVFDVKSKTKIAYKDIIEKLDKDFNDILEAKTKIGSEKEYSRVKAKLVGKGKGNYVFFVPPSADDFAGMLQMFEGKGVAGDNAKIWFKKYLHDPYARAMAGITQQRIAFMNDYNALKKQIGIVPKNLNKKIAGDVFTNEQAVRVYMWNKQGMEIPGLSKKDLNSLIKHVQSNEDLQIFGDQLIGLHKDVGYPKPGKYWAGGTTTTDILRGIETEGRAKHLQEWKRNADIIFTNKNLNKIEAAFGPNLRESLTNMLKRMETGRNRDFSTDTMTGKFTDWLNGAIGSIMFFNTRSALLQTISTVNFINYSDNNMFKAAKAFANQKQYWGDFKRLMNSDFLVDRRRGLRFNVNEADIANMAKEGGARGIINKLLEIGFLPTQIADSFAIAAGGASFYRNRISTYVKQGMSQKEAEAKSFREFREIAEETQQSSRPDRISQQQAGPLGRILLAFQNVTMQFNRRGKKDFLDLKNKRRVMRPDGGFHSLAKSRQIQLSRMGYYFVVQNLIFNALQQGIFAIAFGNDIDDDKEKEKYFNIANGTLDSVLRGTGIMGGVASVLKNAAIRIDKESKKNNPKYEKVGYELTRISPPISSKLSKVTGAARSFQWNKEEMREKGLSIDNPALLAGAQVVNAAFNVPVDRAIIKANNLTNSTKSDLELWERLALIGGWQDWEIDMSDDRKSKSKSKPKQRSRN